MVVRAPDAPDPRLDNEDPRINSDGVQLYVDAGAWMGYGLIPVILSEDVYIRPLAGTAAESGRVQASWRRTKAGYDMTIWFDVRRRIRRGDRFRVNLVVNLMLLGHDRRVGQLVLSGDAGWVYLRGDREYPEGAVILEIQ
jgi:hypothetical protein